MSDQIQGDVPAAVTPRLKFDNEFSEPVPAATDVLEQFQEPTEEDTAIVIDNEGGEDRNGEIPTDLDELSVDELKRHQEEIDRKIREKQEAEKKAVIDQIVNVVNTYSIPVEDLVEALGGMTVKRKGVKAKQKYQDPDTGATWSGRGKEPAWIKGKDRKKFLIPD